MPFPRAWMPGGDSAYEARDGGFWQPFGVMEVVAAELVGLQCDLLTVVRC